MNIAKQEYSAGEPEDFADDWLAQAEWLAQRYAANRRTIKAAFRRCGLPASTGYALVGVGRFSRSCSAPQRARLYAAGGAKARLIAAADAPIDELLELAEALKVRELARRLKARPARNPNDDCRKGDAE